jgi:uncharacterized protein YyaL (SSP411 family)
MTAYGVTRHGNASTGSAHGFEGKSILEFVGELEQRPSLAEICRKPYEVREERVHSGLHGKVLTSWNGLMLAAFAEAVRALDRGTVDRPLSATLTFCCASLDRRTVVCCGRGKQVRPSSTATWGLRLSDRGNAGAVPDNL